MAFAIMADCHELLTFLLPIANASHSIADALHVIANALHVIVDAPQIIAS